MYAEYIKSLRAKTYLQLRKEKETNKFFKTLKKDHKEIKDILGKLEETEAKSGNRDELFQKLKEALIPHMKAEETSFYPVLLEKKDAKEAALEGVKEHHVSDMVFKELEKMPKDTDEWGAKLSVFKELVGHHIKEEEGLIFKVSEIVLTEDKLQTILKQFQEDKQKVQKKLK